MTAESQPSASFCWGTMNPITTEDSGVTIENYSVGPVDTRNGAVTVNAPTSCFGISDTYDNFTTAACTVIAPEGVLIYDPSGTFGMPYGTKALLNSPGSYYWRPGIFNDQTVLFLDNGGEGGGSSNLGGLFIFRPGGVAKGNVYVTEAALAAAMSDTEFATLVIDLSLVGGTLTFTTVGLLNVGILTNWVLGTGGGNSTECEIVFSAGTTIPMPASIKGYDDGAYFIVEQANDLISAPDSLENRMVIDGVTIGIGGSGNFMTVSEVTVALRSTNVSGGGSGLFINGIGIVSVDAFSSLGANVLSTGTAQIQASGGSSVDSSLYAAVSIKGLYTDTSGTGTDIPPANCTDQLMFTAGTLYYSNGSAWVAI